MMTQDPNKTEPARTQVLVLVPCQDEIRTRLQQDFKDQYLFTFSRKETVSTEQLQKADIIIGEPEAKQLTLAANLKWLQLTWAGADKYTSMKAFPSHVLLTNASGAFGTIISEYVVGAILAQYRHFPTYWKNQQENQWNKGNSGESIAGRQVLILGTGDIGENIARRLRPFQTSIIGINRSGRRKDTHQDFDAIHSADQLDRLLLEADIVIGALPGTAETRGLLTKSRLWSMKKNALLVNVGRGSLVSSEDLADVLLEGHLKGAVLDVMDPEPLPQTSRLWNLEQVMITPHISGPSFGTDPYTTDRIWKICMENLDRYREGIPLKHMVSMTDGY